MVHDLFGEFQTSIPLAFRQRQREAAHMTFAFFAHSCAQFRSVDLG